MQVLQSFEELLDDLFFVDFFQDVSSDDCVEVGFHLVEYTLYIFVIFGSDDV